MAFLPVWRFDAIKRIEPRAATESEARKLLDRDGVPLCVGLGLVVLLIPELGWCSAGQTGRIKQLLGRVVPLLVSKLIFPSRPAESLPQLVGSADGAEGGVVG